MALEHTPAAARREGPSASHRQAQEPRTAPGTKPIALLLPGMTLNATIFPDLGVQTIAVDFNELVDDGWRAVSQRKMDLYAQMLQDFVQGMTRWRESRRIVVAHSFGGMLALRWLSSRKDQETSHIHGLVLISTTAGPMFENLKLRLGRFLGREWRVQMGALLPLWNTAVVTRSVKRILCRGELTAQHVDFRALERRTDVALDLAGWRNTDWRAMRSYRLALQGFDVRERLGEIQTPAIVLHGTRDTLFSLAVADDLARRLPRATLRVVEGAGHGLPLTHGESVREAVWDLLSGG